jgi:hypothetical protein
MQLIVCDRFGLFARKHIMLVFESSQEWYSHYLTPNAAMEEVEIEAH